LLPALVLAACGATEPAPLEGDLSREDLVVGTADEGDAGEADTGGVVQVAALPERYQEILDLYRAGGLTWTMERASVLSDPDETRFLVDNLMLAMFEQARAIQRAQKQLASSKAHEQSLARIHDELVACGPPAAEALAEVLAVGDDFFAAMARNVLERMGADAAPAVAGLLERDKAVERYRALQALAQLPGARDLEPAVCAAIRGVATGDEVELVRAEAAKTLGERGLFAQSGLTTNEVDFQPWIDALIATLDDPSDLVQKNALYGLAFLGERSAVPAVIAAGRSGTQVVQIEARKTLQALTGERFGLDWNAWQVWWNGQEG